MKDIISQAANSVSKSLKPWNTLLALWILFFIENSHILHYIPLKVHSNKVKKKFGPIKIILKMQKTSL
jgi:hypothetical protein